MRVWEPIHLWWETRDNCGEDGVGYDKASGSERKWLLAADRIEDEGDEAVQSAITSVPLPTHEATLVPQTVQGANTERSTHKKFVMGPTAP